jgi:hypothetical protein
MLPLCQMRCLAVQRIGYIQRLLLGKAKRFREQFALKVEDAPEPSDVLYEHLEYGASKWVPRLASPGQLGSRSERCHWQIRGARLLIAACLELICLECQCQDRLSLPVAPHV